MIYFKTSVHQEHVRPPESSKFKQRFRKNNDVIEAKRLLNLSFDFRSDVNGLSINARTIDIAIYTITTLIFIKKNKNAPIPNKDRIDFKIDFVN